MARANKHLVEPRFKESIDAWVQDARPTGGFLAAVLDNDLLMAVGRGDDAALDNLPHIVSYLVNECPPQCWGSPEKTKAWCCLYPVKEA